MKLPLPPTILLDLDDTILHFSANTVQAWQLACDEGAPHLSPPEREQLTVEIRRTAAWYWSSPERHRAGRLDLDRTRERIVHLTLRRLKMEQPALSGEIARLYGAHRTAALQPFPGAIETLQALKERGIRLALITNGAGTVQREKIDRFGLAPYFDCILIEGELGVGKPEEQVYREALARLGARPEEAWMIGDNLEWEVVAPQRVGIVGIWVDVAGEGLPPGTACRPDRIIRTLAEIL